MKYLIIGGTGVIGYKILQHIRKEDSSVKFTFLNNKEILKNSHFLNIENLIETKNLIKKISPDIVIHCSALSNIDFCENNKRKAESINVLGTKNIVEGCKDCLLYTSPSPRD